MNRLEILLGEESAERVLRALVPKIVGAENARTVAYRTFRGKGALIRQLPTLLKGYKARIKAGEQLRVLVLIDQDSEDCEALKRHLEQIVLESGLIPRSMATTAKPFQVLNRIAVEELEAWYFGDIAALRQAYPKAVERLNRFKDRDPDSISDPTKNLERFLKQAGYYRNGMPKIEVAQRVAAHMQPERNRSRSFQVFCEGLKACLT
ncbi:MAG: DUF4276 family protein [Aggregatilineales bacterium]